MTMLVAAAVIAAVLTISPAPVQAGAAADAALALGAFAVFNQLFLLPALARPVYTAPAPVVYARPPAVGAPAPPLRSGARLCESVTGLPERSLRASM